MCTSCAFKNLNLKIERGMVKFVVPLLQAIVLHGFTGLNGGSCVINPQETVPKPWI